MDENKISNEWLKLFNTLSESQKRWAAAVKASEIGYGGISMTSRVTELSRTTITQGMKEIDGKLEVDNQAIRKKGGGRKPVITQNINLTK